MYDITSINIFFSWKTTFIALTKLILSAPFAPYCETLDSNRMTSVCQSSFTAKGQGKKTQNPKGSIGSWASSVCVQVRGWEFEENGDEVWIIEGTFLEGTRRASFVDATLLYDKCRWFELHAIQRKNLIKWTYIGFTFEKILPTHHYHLHHPAGCRRSTHVSRHNQPEWLEVEHAHIIRTIDKQQPFPRIEASKVDGKGSFKCTQLFECALCVHPE